MACFCYDNQEDIGSYSILSAHMRVFSLPPELFRDSIFPNIKISDVKHVSLASKRCHSLALPTLLEKLRLTLGELASMRQTLRLELVHCRSLTIVVVEAFSCETDMKVASREDGIQSCLKELTSLASLEIRLQASYSDEVTEVGLGGVGRMTALLLSYLGRAWQHRHTPVLHLTYRGEVVFPNALFSMLSMVGQELRLSRRAGKDPNDGVDCIIAAGTEEMSSSPLQSVPLGSWKLETFAYIGFLIDSWKDQDQWKPLVQFLADQSSLQTLRLRNIHALHAFELSTPLSITSLQIVDWPDLPLDSWTAFASLCNAAPNLQHIAIKAAGNSPLQATSLPVITLTSLQDLELEMSAFDVPSFFQSTNIPALRTLTITNEQPWSVFLASGQPWNATTNIGVSFKISHPHLDKVTLVENPQNLLGSSENHWKKAKRTYKQKYSRALGEAPTSAKIHLDLLQTHKWGLQPADAYVRLSVYKDQLRQVDLKLEKRIPTPSDDPTEKVFSLTTRKAMVIPKLYSFKVSSNSENLIPELLSVSRAPLLRELHVVSDPNGRGGHAGKELREIRRLLEKGRFPDVASISGQFGTDDEKEISAFRKICLARGICCAYMEFQN